MRAPLHAGPRAHGPGAAAPDAVAAQLPHQSCGRAGRRQRQFRASGRGRGASRCCASRRARRWPSVPSRTRWSRRTTSTACTGCAPAKSRRPCCSTASAARLALAKFMLEADRPPAVDPEQAWSAFSRARGPRARGDGRRVRRARAVRQPRAQRGRVRARSTWRASGRSGCSRRPPASATSRRTSTTAAGARRRSASLARDGALGAIPTSSTSTCCGSRSRRRSTLTGA